MNLFTTILIQPLANGLIVCYKIFGGNMGLAIIGFSVFLRFILNPLTKPYMQSMKKMKEVAPLLDKLKKKYPNDKIKLAQAQADLYKQKGVNPSAGCIPYILQIVVLIAFFNVFSRTLYPNVDTIKKFNELLYEPLKFVSGQEINTKFLYLDIKKPDTIKLDFLPFAIPGPVLILAAVVQFVSAKISVPFIKEEEKLAKKTESSSDDMQVAMQQSMIYTFPLMTLLIGLRFPSGLAIYWLIFSLLQAQQQYKSQGWGGLTPFIKRWGLIKSKAL
jgi:YidC/Oxa1 family membrane protein insertase